MVLGSVRKRPEGEEGGRESAASKKKKKNLSTLRSSSPIDCLLPSSHASSKSSLSAAALAYIAPSPSLSLKELLEVRDEVEKGSKRRQRGGRKRASSRWKKKKKKRRARFVALAEERRASAGEDLSADRLSLPPPPLTPLSCSRRCTGP